MRNTVLIGDCLSHLKTLPDNSIQCCVTSPPYWGLRDYQCSGQIGLEPTPEKYVASLVTVFREVKRVLRYDATCWLNLGDSFLDKNLLGIPWRVALALQADGWYLRSDIIWFKGNPMPEAVMDRPTKSHEYIFLLTKSEKYFYDQDATREPHKDDWHARASTWRDGKAKRQVLDSMYHTITEAARPFANPPNPAGRNKRSVWSINTRPFSGAHFAVFPPEIPEICIKAGTSEKGCCPTCGAPWKRDVICLGDRKDNGVSSRIVPENHAGDTRTKDHTGKGDNQLATVPYTNIGWVPTCMCPEQTPIPCIVLDPFAGSGTTLMVAKQLGRDYIGIELNPEYAKIIAERVRPAQEEQDAMHIFNEFFYLP